MTSEDLQGRRQSPAHDQVGYSRHVRRTRSPPQRRDSRLCARHFRHHEGIQGVGLAATQVGVDLAVITYGCPAGDEVSSRPPVGESEGRPYLRWVPEWPTVVSDRCSEGCVGTSGPGEPERARRRNARVLESHLGLGRRAYRIPARSSCRSGCKSQGCTRLLLPSLRMAWPAAAE